MMFRKIFLLSILIFSFSYAVDEIDIEKRRQEQQDFDNLIRNQNFSVPKNNEIFHIIYRMYERRSLCIEK